MAINEDRITPLKTVLERYYALVGNAAMKEAPPMRSFRNRRLKPVFDKSSRRVVDKIDHQFSILFDTLHDAQTEAIGRALRFGIENEYNEKKTAQLIAGVLNARGRRMGGLRGLNKPQSNALMNFEMALNTPTRENWQSMYRRQLNRKLLDPTARRLIQNALRTDTRLNVDQILEATERYRESLSHWRARVIARTEILTATSRANDEAVQQMLDTGALDPNSIVKVWRTSRDKKVRDVHALTDGQEVPYGDLFDVAGEYAEFPGDFGLSARSRINCRCSAI